MDAPRKSDRMSSMPLLDMSARESDSPSGNEHLSWSDQEFEDVSQDPLEGVLRSVLLRPKAINRQQCVLSAAFISALSIATGFCAAYFIFFVLYPPLCAGPRGSLAGHLNMNITKWILREVDPESIRGLLRNLTEKPHIAGYPQNLALAEYVKSLWTEYGLSDVKLVPYSVLLSYPYVQKPNSIQVKGLGQKVLNIAHVAMDDAGSSLWPTFNAYSPAGQVTGDPVYVNFGRPEDFELVSGLDVDLTGKIVIARCGLAYRGQIVKLAESYNASGVIIFSDPHEFAPEGRENVYPNKFYLPGDGTQAGSVLMTNGDPSTPSYPSVDEAFRLPMADLVLPKIPVQPIGYDDAEKLLSLMSGYDSPIAWKGALNVSYKIGPGFTNQTWRLHLNVYNVNSFALIHNVIGTIPGAIEPDRYVILGNHRDAWNYGGIDPNSGTAVLIELTRVFGKLLKTGWRPRRTLVFCSWDAEEYGLIGSTEWVEEKIKILGERAVAYLNVDLTIEGNYSIYSGASPLLFDVIYDSTKKIPNPNPAEVEQGRATMYDTWLHTSNSTNKPKIEALGDGSDHAAFMFFAGVPSCDYYYKGNSIWYPAGNPLYHSVYETFDVVDTLLDPGFKYHAAVAQLWGETAASLAESELLPFSVISYAELIEEAFKNFKNHYGDILKKLNVKLDYLQAAVQNFSYAAHSFHSALSEVNVNDPLMLRRVNDQMMQVERSFIQPEGVPPSLSYRHVIMSPSSTDNYVGQYFPGLTNLLSHINSKDNTTVQHFNQHLAAVTFYIKSAVSVLSTTL